MTHEVGSPILHAMLIPCQRMGLPIHTFFEGLGVGPGELEDPGSRLDWDDFAVLAERARACIGSDVLFETMMRDAPRSIFSEAQCRALFPDFRTLAAMVGSLMATSLHRGLQLSTRIQENGWFICEHHIPRSYRASRTFAVGLAGFLRGLPRLYGQLDAEVAATFDDRNGLYRLMLQDPLDRGSQPGAGGPERTEAGGETERISSYLLAHVADSPWFARFGQGLLVSTSFQELAARLEEGLRREAGCPAGSLWIAKADGDMRCVHAWGPVAACLQAHLLASGTHLLGRVDLPQETLSTAAGQRIAREMLTLVSIVIEGLLERTRSASPSELQASFTASRGLTVRQQQVLFLLVQGLSDKEIGQALGTSPKTVGHQVGSLLRKCGADNRTALASRCLAAPAAQRA